MDEDDIEGYRIIEGELMEDDLISLRSLIDEELDMGSE